MLLRTQIELAEIELRQALVLVETHRKHIMGLRKDRLKCNHKWENPTKGYEHEGCRCALCGINDIEL